MGEFFSYIAFLLLFGFVCYVSFQLITVYAKYGRTRATLRHIQQVARYSNNELHFGWDGHTQPQMTSKGEKVRQILEIIDHYEMKEGKLDAR